VTRDLGTADIVWFCASFEFAMLVATGTSHLFGAARPTALLTPRRAGGLELAIAVATLAAVLAQDVGAVLATQAAVALLVTAFVVFLVRLRRSTDARPCGCHPFSGPVVNASFVPAGALGGAAAVMLAGVAVEGDVGSVEVVPALVVATIAALAAGAALVYSGAAGAPLGLLEGE
jgi:hypothetical protein